MTSRFDDLSYLLRGSAAQRRAHQALLALELPGVLQDYSPLLVGTFPLDLQRADSDLDLICEVHDLAPFERLLARWFGHLSGFAQRRTVRQGLACSVTSFSAQGLPVEVFGQPLPTRQQFGYRHLLVEHRLLQVGGPDFRAEVQALRATGLKTEPAFIAALGWTGPDPYSELLALETYSEPELRNLLRQRSA